LAQEDSSIFNSTGTLIVLGILLGSLIISAAILMAGNSIGDKVVAKLTGNVVLAPTGNGNANPTPNPTDQGNQPAAPTANMADLVKNAAATIGSDNAPVVIVEYSDFQCPFCRRWEQETKPSLLTNYINTGKVKLVYKDFPLSFHENALNFSEAARCAGDQGKFWDMHGKIVSEQDKVTTVTVDNIKQWATDLGLNTTTFNSCFDSKKFASAIQANQTEGSALGVSGTPSFFIGKANGTGQLVVGAQPYATFQSAIDALLQ